MNSFLTWEQMELLWDADMAKMVSASNLQFPGEYKANPLGKTRTLHSYFPL
jgi:hypothetical protein